MALCMPIGKQLLAAVLLQMKIYESPFFFLGGEGGGVHHGQVGPNQKALCLPPCLPGRPYMQPHEFNESAIRAHSNVSENSNN